MGNSLLLGAGKSGGAVSYDPSPKTRNASIFQSIDYVGGNDDEWDSPENAELPDDIYATRSFSPFMATNSQWLAITGLGFNIPPTATVTGVQVSVDRSATDDSISDNVGDEDFHLISGGVMIGENKASDSDLWPTIDDEKRYGDSTDLWDATLTPAIINASDFGFALKPTGVATAGVTAKVDYINITVWYTV